MLPRGAGAGRWRGATAALRLRSHRLLRCRVNGVGGARTRGGARALGTQAQCDFGGAGRRCAYLDPGQSDAAIGERRSEPTSLDRPNALAARR